MADMAVELVPYDPSWPVRFAEQRDRVSAVLADRLAAPVEHIGSTSVPGLWAKPVVDLLAPVGSLGSPAAREAMVEALSADGWLYWPDDPHWRTRLWFLRPRPEARTHHLQVVEHGGPRAGALLTFRDALRRDPELAEAYRLLKSRLAAEHQRDREAYTRGKAAFVAGVLATAGTTGAEAE
jgi:GrpB-like predicted nucleotidyltransferase (UPF0157 family)